MSKSNPFAAPKALVDTPGALEAIAETVKAAEPVDVNSSAAARVDAGAQPVSLNGDGENQFGGIPASDSVVDPNPEQDSGGQTLTSEAGRVTEVTTDEQRGVSTANAESSADVAADGSLESSEADDEATAGAEKPAEVNPDSHSKDELVAMATDAGVATDGTKAEIAARINEKNGY